MVVFCLNSIAGPRLCILGPPVTFFSSWHWTCSDAQSRFSSVKETCDTIHYIHLMYLDVSLSSISMRSMFISLHSNPKESQSCFPNVSHRHHEGIREEVWKGQRGGQANGLLDESRSCLAQWQLEHWFTVVISEPGHLKWEWCGCLLPRWPFGVLSMLPSPRKAKFDAAKLPYEFSEAALVSRQLMCDGAVIAIGVKVKYLIYDSYPIHRCSYVFICITVLY